MTKVYEMRPALFLALTGILSTERQLRQTHKQNALIGRRLFRNPVHRLTVIETLRKKGVVLDEVSLTKND